MYCDASLGIPGFPLHVTGSLSTYWGSKVITRNYCMHAEGSLTAGYCDGGLCEVYSDLLALHKLLLRHIEVKLDVEALHKLSDGVSIGIGLLMGRKGGSRNEGLRTRVD